MTLAPASSNTFQECCNRALAAALKLVSSVSGIDAGDLEDLYRDISQSGSLNSDLRDLEVHPTEDDVGEEGFTGQECQDLIESIQQDACEEKEAFKAV